MLLILPLSAQDMRQDLKKHVTFLSDDKLKGRGAGTEGERMAASYLYDRLEEVGVIMLNAKSGQDFSIKQEGDTIASLNILGIVEGYDPELKNEYVVIGTSMDHIGTNLVDINGEQKEQIYPGAYKNASGLASLIEIARKITATSFLFKRSVVFVGFGAEEMGMAGSWYFVNHGFKEIGKVSLMIDINMIGKAGPSNPFFYYTAVPNPELAKVMGKVVETSFFDPPIMGYGKMNSSAYLAFYEKEIPVTLFTTGSHKDVNSVRDLPSGLDYDFMERACELIYSYSKEVANLDTRVSKVVSIQASSDPEKNVYSKYDVDRQPEFFRGDDRTFLEKWVYSYLKYPDIPLAQGIQGVVYVEFIIEPNGELTNVKIVKSVDEYLDAEAVKVISASPKWKAGVLGGKKVRVKYSIPVEFRLESSTKSNFGIKGLRK